MKFTFQKKYWMLLLFVSFVVFPAMAQVEPCYRSIEVTGKAIIKVVPDELFLDIVLIEKEGKGKPSIDQLEKKLKRVIDNLEIPNANLVLSNASSQFEKDLFKKGGTVIKNYQLKVGSAAQMNKVYQECKKLEIDNVRLTHYDYSKRQEALMEARILALKAAKTKADYMLEAIGQTTGKAISITEVNVNNYRDNNVSFNVMESKARDLDNVGLYTSFKEIKIQAAVHASFEIE